MTEETGQEVKLFTLAEVKIHNGKDDPATWIIYKDIVYDVTSYLDDHPGGGDLITEFAGLDCTKGFDDFGHSSDAKKQLKAFKIREIVEEERRGKAKKKPEVKSGVTVKDAPDGKPQTRSCISIVTCGLCG
ncbi:cytochrome b5-like [Sitophilus oryzae]|uniref:Cytochrome b5 n=1 Tax=Sitophilus oryzae TaxID=7048 RepID=A0A6J2YW61_SITOR|nr:cytochrome b5-like [Sitophilus oryzae]